MMNLKCFEVIYADRFTDKRLKPLLAMLRLQIVIAIMILSAIQAIVIFHE